ncbi:MAG: hypothetical protein ABEL76_11295, partial [Bradymonadaceae bacterium]
VAIAGDRQNAWVGGRLAIVDRHMGPDLRAGQSPENAALPGYTPSYRPLDGRASPTGQSKGGLYRDPAAMQDGSILVAHSPSAADIGNPDADVEYRIERLDIDEAPEGCHSPDCMPRIGSRSVVADAKDVSLFDPTPVAPWVAPAETESVLDHSKPARYSMNDPAVNNAISSN